MWRKITPIALIVLIGAALFAGTGEARSGHAAKTQPTLGGKQPKAYHTEGFDRVKPKVISFGGDPTSGIGSIHWSSWGGRHAVGHGIADWVWPGWCVACASTDLRATVVAFDLGRCQGHEVYQFVEWYFPSRGEYFSSGFAYENLCPGRKSPTPPKLTTRRCGTATLSGGAAKDITSYDLKCKAAVDFVKISGALSHYGHNAKFETHGWWCGSELSMQSNAPPPQDFTCVHGDYETVIFELTPSA